MRNKKYTGVYPRVLEVLDFETTESGNVSTLKPDVLKYFLQRNQSCRCSEPPVNLRPGMSLYQINRLGAGCKAGSHVCPTLDSIRRRMGH